MSPAGSIPDAAPLAACRRVAIVMPTWLGDTVMATPVLAAIRAHLPHATIIGLMQRGFDELLDGSGLLDEPITINRRGVLPAAGLIRRAKADAVLLLPNSFRWGLSAWLGRTPRRIGYARDGRGPLLTHRLGCDKRELVSTGEHYRRLGEFALGGKAVDPRPRLTATRSQQEAAADILADCPKPFVLLVPGGNRASKRWPADRFARLAEQLSSVHGLAVAVSGSPGERDVIDEVVRGAKTPIIDLSTRGLTLGTLKAVLGQAAILITNDTGPRHIALAFGTPVVTLFGPTDYRWTTSANPREVVVLAEPFLPEKLVADRHAEVCRMDRIDVEDALAAATRLLTTPFPAP
jgi:heptosyltransferase II